jgi:dTMP kinase
MKLSALYVFEGPDGVGKSTIAEIVAEKLQSMGRTTRLLAFPGREEGTLGRLVYELHHDLARFGVSEVGATSLQLLHIAAHLDAIEKAILPALARGETVVLDRFWWSTVVYGRQRGVSVTSLEAMIDLERIHWGGVSPGRIFLIDRAQPFRPESSLERYEELRREYRMLAAHAENALLVDNSGTVASTVNRVLEEILSTG